MTQPAHVIVEERYYRDSNYWERRIGTGPWKKMSGPVPAVFVNPEADWAIVQKMVTPEHAKQL